MVKIIAVRLSEADFQKVEENVREGKSMSRADFLRTSAILRIEELEKIKKKGGNKQ